jgi:hypothetical protein
VSEKDIGSCHEWSYLEKAAFHNKSGREGEETILPNQRLFSCGQCSRTWHVRKKTDFMTCNKIISAQPGTTRELLDLVVGIYTFALYII